MGYPNYDIFGPGGSDDGELSDKGQTEEKETKKFGISLKLKTIKDKSAKDVADEIDDGYVTYCLRKELQNIESDFGIIEGLIQVSNRFNFLNQNTDMSKGGETISIGSLDYGTSFTVTPNEFGAISEIADKSTYSIGDLARYCIIKRTSKLVQAGRVSINEGTNEWRDLMKAERQMELYNKKAVEEFQKQFKPIFIGVYDGVVSEMKSYPGKTRDFKESYERWIKDEEVEEELDDELTEKIESALEKALDGEQ